MALTRPRYSDIVDSDYKNSVRVVTITDITLAGGAPNTYDTISFSIGDRVLVTGQATGSQNGIYSVQTVGNGTNGTWVRSFDANDNTKLTAGMQVPVAGGTYAGTYWKLVTGDPIVLDSTTLVFVNGSTVAGGSNQQIQYNYNNIGQGAPNFIYDYNTGNVVILGTTPSTANTNGAMVIKGGLGVAGNVSVGGDLLLLGNLTSQGSSFNVSTQDLVINDSVISLHTWANLAPLLSNDGRDIGLKLHYYDVSDNVAFLGRGNDTGYLEWYSAGQENSSNVFINGIYGTIKTGNVLLTGNLYRGSTTVAGSVQTHAIAYTTSPTPPVNPQNGDQWYDTSSDTVYEWVTDGTSAFWVDKLGTATTVTYTTSATPPAAPKSGDYWYDTSTDTLYTRVYDGTSQYWVDFSTQSATVSQTYLQTGYLVANNINTIGNVVVQGTLSAASITFTSLNVPGPVQAQDFQFANGVSLISSIPGIYGDSNVSSYLSSGTLSVTDTTSTTTGSIVTPGGVAAAGNVYVGKNLYIGPTAFGQSFANPTIVAVDNGSNYAQMAMKNINSVGSADYAAYADNGSDAGGWIDMGVAGSTYNDPNYTITKPQDGSLLVRPTSKSYGGNLIIGTSEAGSYNDIVFSVGSFYSNAEVARFHGNTSNNGGLTLTGTANINYTPTSALGSAIQITGKDTQGGTGWFDFLKATNTTSGATNPNKFIRLNSTGGLEVINSAYSATLLTLSDAGAFSVVSTVAATGFYVNNKQAVNGPAFRAYIAVNQAITSGSQQKVVFGSETFDTNSNFASSAFTPTVEGYYQLNATVRIAGSSGTGECMITIWKNGSEYARGNNESGTEQGASWYSMQVSDIAYANGTTDYFEIYIQQTSGGNRDTTAGQNISYFSGAMIRGA